MEAPATHRAHRLARGAMREEPEKKGRPERGEKRCLHIELGGGGAHRSRWAWKKEKESQGGREKTAREDEKNRLSIAGKEKRGRGRRKT